ncbi:HMG box transcription factor BBX [Papilio xuthus]|uniref:HMG box transcription factor BBX n=1 Tax=Papilio xuthus TaxID=66420 RepID=A0A194PE71_PAPXU|nr:HMG box transcription factor BBX [Papilio xuthus]
MHEQEGEGEPAHHARRPMNAFLIFCKRHRSVVRDRYPNLENRSITKILGEWWANLDKEEKSCYTSLAKQYKDAFFSANPDFKWYKLPAPPLRTLSSRPRDADKTVESPGDCHYPDLEKTNNNSTKVDLNKKPADDAFHNDAKPLSMFTPGKLADEAQMGGLSSLLATKTEIQTPNPYYSPPSFKFSAISTPMEDRSQHIMKCNRDDELQDALTETTRIFEEDFDEKGQIYRYGVPNDQFTNQDVINQIVDKRYSTEEGYQRNWSDDEKSKSGRTCKGKRYQEFMAVGGLIVNKRPRRDFGDKTPDESYSASCSWDPGNSYEESYIDDLKPNYVNEVVIKDEVKYEPADAVEPDNNSSKTFKAADFDLDAKIRALPSLSLEKFLQKKRENKRKKKTINLKPKALETSQIINSVPRPPCDERREMAERWRDHVIGSQKRKPRKISITRLEVNSMVSCDTTGIAETSPEMKLATEAPCGVMAGMEACGQAHHSAGLLALATLAEVAANTSKIEDPAPAPPPAPAPAPARGDRTSEV